LATIKYNQSNHKEAIKLYNQAIAVSPDYDSAHFMLANAFSKLCNFTGAKYHYEEVIRINSEFKDINASMGNVFMNMNDIKNAVIYYIKAQYENPDLTDAQNYLVHIYMNSSKYSNAIHEIESSLKSENYKHYLYFELASVLQAAGEWTNYESRMKDLVEITTEEDIVNRKCPSLSPFFSIVFPLTQRIRNKIHSRRAASFLDRCNIYANLTSM